MSVDTTVRVFDSFYGADLQVDASSYEIAYAFFKNICATDDIAKTFAQYIFIIETNTGIPAIELLSLISDKNGIEIDAIMAFYLNSVKTKTALYGVANELVPNYFVARNIII